ncbi:MAG TPA: ABC transporter ATP-binding protein [Candidatus Lumbricidophila sp.]|nr:ABC transporter ATP-binding protein [Candidatus Lumbricidophila sp.]
MSGVGATGLHVTGLCVERSGCLVLTDCTFTAPRGSVTAIVGPNGAGKTSLLHALAGALPATGAATFDGHALLGSARGIRSHRSRTVALVEQSGGQPSGVTVRELVALGRVPHLGRWGAAGASDDAAVDRALTALDLATFADHPIDRLSGGERQRASIARALAQEPSLLLLDEPMNHLDIRHQLDTVRLLRQLANDGCAVLVTLHDLTLAATLADQLVVLHDGSVEAVGAPEAVLTPARIHQVWQVEGQVLTGPHGRPLVVFAP